jgi:tetratricopeptide (TPR) repeat protein
MHMPANALIMGWALGILANPCIVPIPAKPLPRFILHAPALAALPLVGVLLILFAGLYFLPEHYNEKARVAHRERQHDQEMRYADEGLKYDTENPELYRRAGSGRLYSALAGKDPLGRLGLLIEAASMQEAALALFPYDDEAWFYYAMALEGSGHLADAERAYLQMIEQNPKVFQTHEVYSNFLFRVGRVQDAQSHLKLAHQYQDGPWPELRNTHDKN